MAGNTVRPGLAEGRYNSPHDAVITRGSRLDWARVPVGDEMELRCPKCGSVDLKKVSVAYEEGLYQVGTRTRLRGLVLGSDEPSVFVGRAKTRGSQQTERSIRLRPPVKCSYGKAVLWFALVLLVSLIGYVHMVMARTYVVSSAPGEVLAFALLALLGAALVIVWRHNHFTYPRALKTWDRSFVCGRCGVVSKQNLNSK